MKRDIHAGAAHSDALNPAVAQPATTTAAGLSPAAFVLAVLLGLDACTILLHVGYHVLGLDNPRFRLEYPRGYGELFMYAKSASLAIGFGLMAISWRQFGWTAWALVFTAVALDDSLELHEKLGQRTAEALAAWTGTDYTFRVLGFRWQDLGELIVFASGGILLGGLLALAYYRSNARFRRASRRLLILLVLLGACAIGVDLFTKHAFVQGSAWLAHLVVVVEDGGELVVISLTLWAVLDVVSARWLESLPRPG